MNYTSSTIDKVPDEVTAMDADELISERYSDCKFALDVNMFNYHKTKDKKIQSQLEKKLKSFQTSPFIQPKRLKA